MMFRKKVSFLFFLMILGLSQPISASGMSDVRLPEGDLLLIYSDGIMGGTGNLDQVIDILTYQNIKVTFAPASEVIGNIEEYPFLLFWDVEQYPQELLEEIYFVERQDSEVQFLFVGNELLRTYLDYTGRGREYYGKEVSTVGRFRYDFAPTIEKEVLLQYDSLLYFRGDLDTVSGTVIAEEKEGYFCARKGNITHITTSHIEVPLVQSAFAKEVSKWMWPYAGQPHSYAQYLVLDKVYPFQDLEKLIEIIDLIEEKKLPFIISVMPVYANGNYPAMQQFCQVLRYAQAKGGVIFLHSPINQMVEFDKELVNEYITLAMSNYIEQGVYPLGLEVPNTWLHYFDTVDVMARFQTILVSEEEDTWLSTRPREEVRRNEVYKDGHQWIGPGIPIEPSGISYITNYSTAVFLDVSEEITKISGTLSACIDSVVPFKSVWDMDHNVWTMEDIIRYENHVLTVNGKQINLDFEPLKQQEEFSYQRNMLQRFSKDLEKENRKLLVVVLVISFLFLVSILRGRIQNRKQFFYPQEEEEGFK